MLFLGIDVGTTGVKAAVFDTSGTIHGYAYQECGINHPAPGQAEQDGEQVFSLMCGVIQRAICTADKCRISALSLSVQGDAVVAVDQNVSPLTPFYLGMDYRCAPQAQKFASEFSETALYQRTGMRPHPMNSLCKIRWIEENKLALAKTPHRYMTYSDFLMAKLGCEAPAIDYTMASRTMGLQIGTMQWDEPLLAAAGITAAQLSEPVPSGTCIGTLKKEIAETWGLSLHTRLIAGGHDQTCAALGAGIYSSEQALDSHGTAEVISTALTQPRTDEAMFRSYFPCYSHVIPGMYFTFSLNHTAGVLLKWFVEGFCQADAAKAQAEGERLYEYVLKSTADVPSPVLVLPYFNGSGTPVCDVTAKGMIAGLTLSTTRYDIARAVLESLCFDMRDNLTALHSAGLVISTLRCVGGGARSTIGLQMKADITNLPVSTLKIRESACYGAALIAASEANAFKDLRKAAQSVLLDKTYYPNPKQVARYTERYALYQMLYPGNQALLSKL